MNLLLLSFLLAVAAVLDPLFRLATWVRTQSEVLLERRYRRQLMRLHARDDASLTNCPHCAQLESHRARFRKRYLHG